MTIIQKIIALKELPGFQVLRQSELIRVAESACRKDYAPGKTVVAPGAVLSHLYIVVEGAICDTASQTRIPRVWGADLLLANLPTASALTADLTLGALCLRLSKRHFFTLIYECPAFLVDLMQSGMSVPK